jgi:hypothetical protein
MTFLNCTYYWLFQQIWSSLQLIYTYLKIDLKENCLIETTQQAFSFLR